MSAKIVQIQTMQQRQAEKVGAVILCLDYLANEAVKDGMPDVADTIDGAMLTVLRLAYDKYVGNPDTNTGDFEQMLQENASFIEGLCKVDDPAVVQELTEKIRQLKRKDIA